MRKESLPRAFWAAPLFILALVLLTAVKTQAVPVVGVTDANSLIVFESSAPGSILSIVTITGLQGGETVLGIDFRPATGQLFALGSTARLYVINPATGVATLQAALTADPADLTAPFVALSGISFGVDFNPTVDRLRVISDADQNLRINPNNGLVTTDSLLAYAAGDPNAAQNPNATGSAYTSNIFGATTTTLYDIDTNLDVLVTQNPPNNGTLNTVGGLGVNVADLLGFDIAPGAAPQTAYAGMRNPSGLGSSGFYTINLASGSATLIGNIGGGEFIRGLTVAPVVPNIYAVTLGNKLLSFNSTSPQILLSNVQITGLGPGEAILGIDFRPANGQLYALGSQSRVYKINTTNGVATEVSGGTPFILNGTSFGFDFNPVPDRIRVVSNTEQNLRLNPDTGGLAATDSNLSYDATDTNVGQNPNIVGAAYTNSFAGATVTTLFNIDSDLDTLVRQGGDPEAGVNPTISPNTGFLFTLGSLGVDILGEVGLDVAAGSNRAFSALQPLGSFTSKLYTVALRTGAGQVGLIGDIGGGEVIRDIAVAPQGTFQFSAQSYAVMEDCTSIEITVTRAGDLSQPASVDFATSSANIGINPASERADYNAGFGKLSFNSGESSKTFRVLINEDSRDEKLQGQQGETFAVLLRNPTNGYFVGTQNLASVLIIDDPVEPATNVIDETPNFVCQHYHDFLNRDPDPAGLQFWTGVIDSCGGNQTCINDKRVQVSAAFFLSIEYQETGFLVYRTYTTAFGPTRIGATVPLTNLEFQPDVQRIGRGVLVGVGNWQAQLETNKVDYFNEFVARPTFIAAFPTTVMNAQYVDALNTNAGGALSQAERDALVTGLTAGTETRATVLRKVAEDSDLKAAQFNRAFVLNEYFGYLRRDPNASPDVDFSGYNFWLNKLNSFNGDFVKSDMVKAFITSGEYRQRFGP